MTLRLLRGRVMIRPIIERRSKGGIWAPDQALDARTNKNTLGRGIVIMMGPPAFAKDGVTEVSPQFAPEDEVLFVGQHISRVIEYPLWTCTSCSMVTPAESPYDVGDSEPCVFCDKGTARVTLEKVHMVAQEEVQACCEPINTAP